MQPQLQPEEELRQLPGELITCITDIISAEKAIFHQLLGLATRKQEAIINDEPASLEEICVREGQLLQQVSDLEQQRVQAIADLLRFAFRPAPVPTTFEGFDSVSKDRGKPQGMVALSSLTVEQVAQLAPPSSRKDLLQCAGELREVVERVNEVNRLNAQLLTHSLALLNYSLDILSGDAGKTTYGQAGERGHESYRSGVLDARA